MLKLSLAFLSLISYLFLALFLHDLKSQGKDKMTKILRMKRVFNIQLKILSTVFKGPSLRQINTFLEVESPTLKLNNLKTSAKTNWSMFKIVQNW